MLTAMCCPMLHSTPSIPRGMIMNAEKGERIE